MGGSEVFDGTGGNGGNREIAILVALFSPSTWFSPFAKGATLYPIFANELKLTDGLSGLILSGANLE
jgi:hypothetical protein